MKTRQLNIRLTQEQYSRFHAIALMHNMDASQYFRAKLLGVEAELLSAKHPSANDLERKVKAAETIINTRVLAREQSHEELYRFEILVLISRRLDEIADYIVSDKCGHDEPEIYRVILSLLQNLQLFTLGGH